MRNSNSPFVAPFCRVCIRRQLNTVHYSDNLFPNIRVRPKVDNALRVHSCQSFTPVNEQINLPERPTVGFWRCTDRRPHQDNSGANSPVVGNRLAIMPRACNASLRTGTSGSLRSARPLGVCSIPALRIPNTSRPRIIAGPTRASSQGHVWPQKGGSSSPNTPAVRVDPQQQISQQQQSPSQRLCRVTFSIKYQTGFGRSLKVIGHGSSLGAYRSCILVSVTCHAKEFVALSLHLVLICAATLLFASLKCNAP